MVSLLLARLIKLYLEALVRAAAAAARGQIYGGGGGWVFGVFVCWLGLVGVGGEGGVSRAVVLLHYTNPKTTKKVTGEGGGDGAAAAAGTTAADADDGDWAELDAGERNSLLSQRLKVRVARVCVCVCLLGGGDSFIHPFIHPRIPPSPSYQPTHPHLHTLKNSWT